MSRKYLIVGVLIAQVILIVALVSAFLLRPSAASASIVAAPPDSPEQAPQAQFTVQGLYLWSYSAKFVCGLQPPLAAGANSPGEPVVKPGNYATDINIHNYNYRPTLLRKKFLVLVNGPQIIREPQQIEPQKIITMTLGQDGATMDDCNNLWQILFTAPPPSPMPLFTGYLVILSPFDLDIDAVYTANAPGDLHTAPTGVSIDVERVAGKRVFVPTGALP